MTRDVNTSQIFNPETHSSLTESCRTSFGMIARLSLGSTEMKFTDDQIAIIDGDAGLTVDQLKEKYGGEDGDHPVITRALFEVDRRLMLGDPKYWPYVEICIHLTAKQKRSTL